MIEKKKLIRVLAFTAYFIAAFLIFLFFLFPFDRIKTMLESEVSSRTPVELSVARISPRFFNRFVLSDVVVANKQGKVLFECASARVSVSLFNLLRGVLALDLKADAYGGQCWSRPARARDGNTCWSTRTAWTSLPILC